MKKKLEKRINIVFFTEYFPATEEIDVHGGVEIRTFFLTKALEKKYRITVIASREENKPVNQIIGHIEVIRVGFKGNYQQKGGILRRISYVLHAVFLSLSRKIDLIEGTGFIGQIPALVVGKITNIPCIAFVPDTISDVSSNFNHFEFKFLSYLEKKILTSNCWKHYIAISETVRKKIQTLGINSNKITLIYCGVELKIPNITKKTSFPSICVISRLVQYKRVIDIVKAIKLLVNEFPDINCSIIGIGEEHNKIENFITENNLSENIKLLGFIGNHNKITSILNNSWIYCSASLVEGFGIANLEAMVTNVPYVIPNIPINQEITKSVGGLFFKPGDISDLAKKLRLLLINVKLRNQIVNNNGEIIKKYSLGEMIIKSENLYRRTLYLN